MTKETIIKVVCDYFGTTLEQVLETKTCRKRELVMVRYFVFKMLKQYTDMSLEQIGFEIDKNHATVLFGIKSVNNLIEIDKMTRNINNEIENRLKYFAFNYECIANY